MWGKVIMYDIEQLQSAWKGHRSFAEWLIEKKQPKVIVELGVDYGYSLFCFANLNIGTVYGIDTFQGDMHTGKHDDAEKLVNEIIEKNNYTNIKIIKDTFDSVYDSWNTPIDVLHIDGLHTYHDTLNDYNKWSKFLSSDGIILMHDVVSFEGVRVVYNLSKLYKTYFEHSSGLGVLSPNKDLIEEIKKKYDLK